MGACGIGCPAFLMRTFFVKILHWFALVASASSLLAAPPANDAFLDRPELFVSNTANGTNVDATLQADEPTPAGFDSSSYQATVWYEWNEPTGFAGWYEITTAGSAIDTVAAVWKSPTLPPDEPAITGLQLVHVNDEASSPGISRIVFRANGNERYFISVAGRNSAARGSVSIVVNGAPDPLINSIDSIFCNPATPDITSAAVNVTATLQMSVRANIASGSFRVFDPAHQLVTSSPFTTAGNRISGNNVSGTYTVSFTLPRFKPPGAYSVSLHLADVTGNVLGSMGWEESTPYAPALSSPTFTVINTGPLDPPVNSVQFALATSSVSEAVVGGSAVITVTRTGDLSDTASVLATTTDGVEAGGALAGTDYTAVIGQVLNYAVNQSSQTVSVPIANRAGNQGDRIFTVSLSSATGATIGSQSSHTVTIQDAIEPSVVEFSVASYTTTQEATTMNVTVSRSGGDSAVSVKLNTTDGSAIAGTDFVGISDQTVSIPELTDSVDVAITLLHPTDDHPNRQFTLSLSNPSSSASLGTRSNATVKILATDSVAPVVTAFVSPTPAINALINGTLGGSITLAGTASDNKGVASVEVSVNNGMTWASTTPTGASWSVSVQPPGGLTTILARAIDHRGNVSATLSRAFTYKVLIALNVSITGTGSVTGKLAGAAYEIGKTYSLTAVPGTGQAFDNWSGPGITAPANELAKLSFTVTPALSLSPTVSATFVPNPYLASNNLAGSYNGIIKAHTSSAPVTVATNATNGFINITITAVTGAFTGSVKLDGATITVPIKGVFDNNGIVKFGTARTATVSLPRTGKPPLTLAMTLNKAARQITGALQEAYRSAMIGQSDFVADRAAYSATALVPIASGLLNQSTTKGYFTAVFPARDPNSITDPPSLAGVTLTSQDYPQGDGTCTIALTNTGVLTYTASLADGTKVVATGNLSKDNTAVFYKDLYGGKGSIGGLITFTRTTSTSVAGSNLFWFRPYQSVQWYPYGWPDGLLTDLFGGEYNVVVGTSVVPGLGPTGLSGNANLLFTDGLLSLSVSKDLNISTTNVISKLGTPPDASYGMVMAPATGLIGGTAATFFTHSNGTKPAFRAVVVQKGVATPGAYGYFLSTAPKIVDGLGESGSVRLLHK